VVRLVEAPALSPPALSIIVPALNEADGIAATLEPLQCARGTLAEIIVVDGGSTDATAAEAGPLADVVLLCERGRALQMNAGAAKAQGNLLLFLHADSHLAGAHVERLVTHWRAVRAQGHPLWGRFDIEFDDAAGLLRLTQWLINGRSRMTGIATGEQAIFVDCELFARCGGFAEIPLMEDVALSKFLRGVTRPLCLHEKVTTSSRRWRKHGVLRTIILMWFLRAAYALGAPPSWLKRRYLDH